MFDRRVGGDAMTQWAKSQRQHYTAAPSRLHLAVTLPMAASNSLNHEARYVNAFTRLHGVLALRRGICGSMRFSRSSRMPPSTLLSKHLVIACEHNGCLVAGSSSVKSGSMLE